MIVLLFLGLIGLVFWAIAKISGDKELEDNGKQMAKYFLTFFTVVTIIGFIFLVIISVYFFE